MISNMMLQAQVTEEQLKESQEIKTETGVVLSWKYLCWVREHPVKSICKETNILYGTQDEMIPYKIVKRFSEENNCRLNFEENKAAKTANATATLFVFIILLIK